MTELLATLAGYLLGSIPFGLIFSKMLRGVDLRKQGSGNIGATNALRVMGFKAAAPVAVCDVLKGLAAVLLARWLGGNNETAIILAALAAVVGHNWPVWLKFNGGKGVATSFGVIAAVSPLALAVVLPVWIAVIWFTRYVSLASMLALVVLPVWYRLSGASVEMVVFGILLAAFSIYRHRENVVRLLNGKENKMFAKKSAGGKK